MSKISGAMVAEKRHTCRAGQPPKITTTINDNKCCCQLIAFRSTLAHFHRAPVNYTHLTGILLQSICNPYYKLQGCLLGEPARQEAGTWRCRRSGPCANSKHRSLKASGLLFPLTIISWYSTLRSLCIQIVRKNLLYYSALWLLRWKHGLGMFRPETSYCKCTQSYAVPQCFDLGSLKPRDISSSASSRTKTLPSEAKTASVDQQTKPKKA